MEWRGRMISTAIILTQTNGERLKQTICLLPPEIDILLLFIIDQSSSLEGMMVSIESMISLNTTLITMNGKRSLHLMTMNLPQQHDILTLLLYMKTQCSYLGDMMVTTRMIFIDLTLLQIPGLKSKTVQESPLHPVTELHALLSMKTCTYLEDMTVQNS